MIRDRLIKWEKSFPFCDSNLKEMNCSIKQLKDLFEINSLADVLDDQTWSQHLTPNSKTTKLLISLPSCNI